MGQNFFWESETQTLGGLIANIYYLYGDEQQARQGGTIDDGGITDGEDFLHILQSPFRAESRSWEVIMSWYAGGAYNFVVTHIIQPFLPKFFGVPISSGPGECASRTEYWWQDGLCTLQDPTDYIGADVLAGGNAYVANDLSQTFTDSSKNRSATELHNRLTIQEYSAKHPTFAPEWTNKLPGDGVFTKGLLMDINGDYTTPSFTATGALRGSVYIQEPLVTHMAVSVEYDDDYPSGPPSQIRLSFTHSGLTNPQYIEVKAISGSYPSATAGRTTYVAEFTWTSGLAGEKINGRFISIQAYDGDSPHSGSKKSETIFTVANPGVMIVPPPWNIPTTDGKIIPGGFIPN